MKQVVNSVLTVLVVTGLYSFLAAFLVVSTGCGKLPNIEIPVTTTTQPSQASAPSVTPALAPQITTKSPSLLPDTSSTVSLTYYSITKTKASTAGGSSQSYTATGSCTVYQDITYCWDDGLHTLKWSISVSYMFWQQFSGGGTTGPTVDLMSSPTALGTTALHLLNNELATYGSPNPAMSTIDKVLTTGTPTTVTCNIDDNNNLVCPTFTIDTTEAPLE